MRSRFFLAGLSKIIFSCALLVYISPGVDGFAADFRLFETRHFTVLYREDLSGKDLDGVKDALEGMYETMAREFGEVVKRPVSVVIFGETGDFTYHTKLPPWSASAMIDGNIYLQPYRVLKKRGVETTTLRHEVALVFLYHLSGKKSITPWLAEGLAVYYSGEIGSIRSGLSGDPPSVRNPDDINAYLTDHTDPEKNRWGYVLAYEEVKRLLKEGEKYGVMRFLAQ